MAMYSLLIVDDEWMIREGLSKTIPWEDWDIQVADTASNGHDAIALMKVNPPDILLTDIRMPGIDGLELVEYCRDTFSHMKLVILTGHNEFKYAQKALRIGADDLILKPTNDKELESIMKRMTAELSDSAATEAETLNLLANQMIEDPSEAVEKKLEAYDLTPCFGCLKIQHQQPLTCDFLTYVQREFTCIELLAENCRLELLFYGIENKRVWIQTVNHLEGVLSNGGEKAGLIASDLCRSLPGWKSIYIQAAAPVENDDRGRGIRWYDSGDYTFPVTEAVAYINKHYDHLLNQSEMADYYYVSTSQFSKQFKKFTGLNFVDYLTEIRIDEGKKLLRHSDMKTYDIAAKTGYVEPRYFSQLFKKKTGMTPRQFREQCK